MLFRSYRMIYSKNTFNKKKLLSGFKKGLIMKLLNPYLNFSGKTEEAFNFYKSVFGVDFVGDIMRFKDFPDSENLPAHEKNQVLHCAIPLGQNLLMASDAPESMGFKVTFGNNFHLYIEADDKAEADHLFSALSEGGQIIGAMQDMFWGAYFGSLCDKFGMQWMISYTYPQE